MKANQPVIDVFPQVERAMVTESGVGAEIPMVNVLCRQASPLK